MATNKPPAPIPTQKNNDQERVIYIDSSMTNALDQNRIEQLKALLCVLAEAIDDRPGKRDLAQLAKQYRETLDAIAELESGNNLDATVVGILARRQSEGKAKLHENRA